MDAVLRKMQFRGISPVVVLDAPNESEAMLSEWAQQATLIRDASEVDAPAPMVLRFVRTCADIERLAAHTVGLLAEDGLLWFAYPKKSSRRYRCDIGRDDSWGALGDLGFEPVRQVAIDEDWSALRFRPVGDITSFTRESTRALSAEGRRRAQSTASDRPDGQVRRSP